MKKNQKRQLLASIEVRRIITSRFTDGEPFASFNALCRELGFEPCKGKRRKELEKEMRCFFEWEKTGTANEICVTALYFNAPKESRDRRTGVHTTPLNDLMQRAILQHIETGTYTKSGILKRLGILYTETGNEGIEFSEFLDAYRGKIFKLLNSSFIQLEKKQQATWTKTYLRSDTWEVVSAEVVSNYLQIKSDVLVLLNEPNEAMVFRHKRWKQYAEQVDEAMYDRYGYSICEKQVVEIQSVPEDLEPVNARELLSAILEDMVRNVDVGFRGFGENRRLVRCRREAEHLKKLLLPES